jgi:hypothetical protein
VIFFIFILNPRVVLGATPSRLSQRRVGVPSLPVKSPLFLVPRVCLLRQQKIQNFGLL